MEALFLAFGSALFGAIIGAYGSHRLSMKRGNMIRTSDITLEITGSEFTGKRISLRKVFDEYGSEKTDLMEFRTSDAIGFQKNLMEVFNRYELICGLNLKNALDENMFEENLKQIIQDDFEYFNSLIDFIQSHRLADDAIAFPDTKKSLGLI